MNFVSLDGLVSGPNGELDWFTETGFMIGEFGEFVRKQLNSVDAILIGRRTYQEFVSFWPTATDSDPVITERMNNLPKIVFSKTLSEAPWGKWGSARLVRGDAVEEVRRLKAQPGRPLVIYGSAQLASSLMKEHLVDEFQLIFVPIVLGEGRPHFKGLEKRYLLEFVRAIPFKTGAVVLCYRPTN